MGVAAASGVATGACAPSNQAAILCSFLFFSKIGLNLARRKPKTHGTALCHFLDRKAFDPSEYCVPSVGRVSGKTGSNCLSLVNALNRTSDPGRSSQFPIAGTQTYREL